MTETKLTIIKDHGQYARDVRSMAWAYREFVQTKCDDKMRNAALSLLQFQHSLGVEVVDTYILEPFEKEAIQLGWIDADWRDEWDDQKVVVAMAEDQNVCVHPKKDQLWLTSQQGGTQ
jgi:hypothetical protein